MKKESKEMTEKELDDLLEQQWNMQDEIHKPCKMKDKKRHNHS